MSKLKIARPRPGQALVGGSRRGYTIVELMMALAVFSIGLVGLGAMQSLVASTTRHSRDLAVANHFARAWQERLSMDALQWGGRGEKALANTQWLTNVTTNNNTWFVPGDALNVEIGAGAGVRGEYVSVAGTDAPSFCAHVRLTHLIGVEHVGMLRAEVRVLWPKGPDEYLSGADTNFCTDAAIPAVGNDPTRYHYVYHTSVIRETPVF